MSINVILFALSFTIAALTGLCFWLLRRNRRLQSLLQTRHAFEEMLARREQEDAREQVRPLPWEQSSEFGSQRVETVSLVDENPLDNEIPGLPEAPHLLLELEPVEGDSGPERSEPVNQPVNQPESAQSALRPLVLGVISHKGGTAKTTTSIELARSWAGKQRRILLVDTDPVQAAAHLLGVNPPEIGEIISCSQEGLFYVHWLPAGWPQPARWPEAFLKGWDLVVVDTPSLQNPLAIQLLPLFDAMVLTLILEPACMRVLEQGAILLERRLDPRRQRLLGVLVTRYQPELALQTSLFSSLQREYVGILLPETIPEDPDAWQELIDSRPGNQASTFRQTYGELARRLYAQLQPLKERAGGQA